MKSCLLLIAFVLINQLGYAQVYKFRTIASWSSYKDANYKWTKLQKEKNGANILVVVDETNDKVSIYTGNDKNLSIIDSEFGQDEKGSFVKYTCIDDENIKCTVTTTTKKDSREVFMTLLWEDTKVVYMLGRE